MLNPDYVPVMKDSVAYYGGSQMWFPTSKWYCNDYVLRNYGCGTIAAADLFLYLALQNDALRSPETELALQGTDLIDYHYYNPYVRKIHDQYTKTHRVIAVLGPALADAINSYSKNNELGYKACWKWSLTYYDMYALLVDMLQHDIPVILSIGPNTPNLWGKKGIKFYQQYENGAKETDGSPHYHYKEVMKDIHGHYVTVTGIRIDQNANTVMLRISSWGKQYFINYEEYRYYIENYGGTYTSGIAYIKRLFIK